MDITIVANYFTVFFIAGTIALNLFDVYIVNIMDDFYQVEEVFYLEMQKEKNMNDEDSTEYNKINEENEET